MKQPLLRHVWGEATAWLDRSRRVGWVDLLILLGLAGLLFGLFDVSREWAGPHRQTVEIDLDSPWALFRYTFYSLSRGLMAYVLSLSFTLVYGYWAAKDRSAERVLIPLLDILQSIPVLGFMPGLVISLAGAFGNSNIGLELAAVIMIFTGQAWNMTFSLYHSIRSVPADQQEAATVYRFNWWQRLRWVELPFATVGLVWNSMMSMAGGWFFLMVNEAFQLKGEDFRLPGLGSYMSVAREAGRVDAQIWAILAMVAMIVALDQFLWRPLTVWAQKFRVEEGGEQEEMASWFLDFLRHSHLIQRLHHWWHRPRNEPVVAPKPLHRDESAPPPAKPGAAWLSMVFLVLLIAGLAAGAWVLLGLLRQASWEVCEGSLTAAGWTLGRVSLALILGTLWALPAGLAIGLSPRLSRLLQPVVQIAASFPAPMLFSMVVAGLALVDVSLDWGSVLLMLLGTQWYILFNVIAGAMAIPADLKEAARSYRISGWQRFRILYVPGVFPYLVTGWVTAAGGAWNASIVAEYVPLSKDEILQANGLGARISSAAADGNFPALAVNILVMSLVVVMFNRTVWRQCYRLAETRFSLSK